MIITPMLILMTGMLCELVIHYDVRPGSTNFLGPPLEIGEPEAWAASSGGVGIHLRIRVPPEANLDTDRSEKNRWG